MRVEEIALALRPVQGVSGDSLFLAALPLCCRWLLVVEIEVWMNRSSCADYGGLWRWLPTTWVGCV